jgi:hypothetical protein
MRDIERSLTVSDEPEGAFVEISDQYDLQSSKAMLWDWFKATTTGNYMYAIYWSYHRVRK